MPDPLSDEVPLALPFLLLGASSAVIDGIQVGMVSRGFDDLRPAHGFAFARLAPDGATAGELATHLGVTKQAAAQLVQELVDKGYVERHLHPADGRARLVRLTQKGWASARAAEESAAEALRPWAQRLGRERIGALTHDLADLASPGRLRPTW